MNFQECLTALRERSGIIRKGALEICVKPVPETDKPGAVDLKTNDVVWKQRIGTVRDSSPVPLPFKMGMPMLGGPITTAGKVFFIGATADNYLRAFSTDTGELLWQARLPAGGQATPMTKEDNSSRTTPSAGMRRSLSTIAEKKATATKIAMIMRIIFAGRWAWIAV